MIQRSGGSGGDGAPGDGARGDGAAGDGAAGDGARGEATYTFGSPVRLGNHPPRRSGPVPSLGQHTAAILESLRAPSGDSGGLAPGAAGDGGAPLPQGGADGR